MADRTVIIVFSNWRPRHKRCRSRFTAASPRRARIKGAIRNAPEPRCARCALHHRAISRIGPSGLHGRPGSSRLVLGVSPDHSSASACYLCLRDSRRFLWVRRAVRDPHGRCERGIRIARTSAPSTGRYKGCWGPGGKVSAVSRSPKAAGLRAWKSAMKASSSSRCIVPQEGGSPNLARGESCRRAVATALTPGLFLTCRKLSTSGRVLDRLRADHSGRVRCAKQSHPAARCRRGLVRPTNVTIPYTFSCVKRYSTYALARRCPIRPRSGVPPRTRPEIVRRGRP